MWQGRRKRWRLCRRRGRVWRPSRATSWWLTGIDALPEARGVGVDLRDRPGRGAEGVGGSGYLGIDQLGERAVVVRVDVERRLAAWGDAARVDGVHLARRHRVADDDREAVQRGRD